MQALPGQPMDTEGEATSLAARHVKTGDTATDHADLRLFKQQDNTSVGKVPDEPEFSYTAGKSENQCNHFGRLDYTKWK